MKAGDLDAKTWIIAERQRRILADAAPRRPDAKSHIILYPQKYVFSTLWLLIY
jgi:hypothetical protein